MCQPKDKGGRRCPAHQPASIGLKKFMTEQYGLLPEQVEHTFKGLRIQARNRPTPTPEQYAHLISRSKEKLENSRLDDKAKRSILRQLDKELTESELPDGATFYALQKLQARSREQKAEFVQAIRQIATHRGTNRNEALRQFREAYANNENKYASKASQPFNGKTYAVVSQLLEKEGTSPSGEALFSDEPRISREKIEGSSWVTSMGYDPDDGRIEIETNGVVYAYHNVPQDMYDRARENHDILAYEVMYDDLYAYSSKDAAAADAGGRYCEDCHKYRAISGHVCEFAPKREVPGKSKVKESLDRIQEQFETKEESQTNPKFAVPFEQRSTNYLNERRLLYVDRNSYLTPDPENIFNAIKDGDIANFEIQESRYINRIEGSTTMDVDAYIDNNEGIIKFRTSNPRCTCEDYRTKHWCIHLSDSLEGMSEAESTFSEGIDALHMRTNFMSFVRSTLDEEGNYHVGVGHNNTVGYYYYRSVSTSTGLNPESWEALETLLNEGKQVKLSLGTISIEDNTNWASHRIPDATFVVKKDEEGIHIESNLKCGSCDDACQQTRHADNYIKQGIDTHFERGRQVDYANMKAGHRLKELSRSMSQTWAMDDDALTEMSRFSLPTGVDHSYSSNLETYISDVRDAEKRIKKGGGVYPVVTSGVTNGACEPGTGRNFGIELEYVLDSNDDTTDQFFKGLETNDWGEVRTENGFWIDKNEYRGKIIRERIAKDLYEAGLSDISRPTEYHSYEGNKWHIEEDCSVSGEVVSPKLSDTPEDWAAVQKVLEIIKKHGGTSSDQTGGHVHMGLGRGEPAEVERRKIAATQIFSAYQDSIRRVQTDPQRKKHRNNYYCVPLDEDSAQDIIYSVRGNHYLEEDHETSFNLGHEGRIEFRGGDGSLDLGHIQAQVATAAGIVTAAERGELEGNKIRVSQVGSNAKKIKLITRGKNKASTDDELIVSDIDFRRFSDDIMNYDYGRQVVAATAANTPWQEELQGY